MTIARLRSIPTGQVRVITHDDGSTTLVSYTTHVVDIDKEGWLTVHGLYSMTTRKHISAFAKEYTSFDYQTLKKCYEDGLSINIYTGEVVDTKSLNK